MVFTRSHQFRVTVRNMLFVFLRWGVVSPTLNPHPGGPPHVVFPRLLIEYIHSYTTYMEAVFSILNPRTPHALVTGTLTTRKQFIHAS